MGNPNNMPIFDAHVHVERGMQDYDLGIVGKNVIFNSVAAYQADRDRYVGSADSVTLIIDLEESGFQTVISEASADRLHGLKIHSRVQKLSEADYPELMSRLAMLPSNLPIIVDTFYYGPDLGCQPCLPAIVKMLQTFPERLFVMAHAGGYRILEYFFHLRTFQNCYYDLSFALQYFEDSSLMQDLRKLLKYTNKQKLLYGSDFPYASARRQYELLLKMCGELGLTDTEVIKIAHTNSKALFNIANTP